MVALHLPPDSTRLSMCVCALQVQRAIETGDPQAVMALRDQLEEVVSNKREQEGELQARLEVGGWCPHQVSNYWVVLHGHKPRRGQSWSRGSWSQVTLEARGLSPTQGEHNLGELVAD